MRQHVAGAQEIQDLAHQLGRLDAADVAHHLGSGARHLAGLYGALQRLRPVLGDDVLAHAHLDAKHQVGVLRHGLGRRLRLREIDVVELRHRKRRQPHVGDVHEGVEPGAGLADDGAAKGGDVVGAGIAG